MLSPTDWGGSTPHAYLGSYRLESDYSWTAADQGPERAAAGDLVNRFLRIGSIPSDPETMSKGSGVD